MSRRFLIGGAAVAAVVVAAVVMAVTLNPDSADPTNGNAEGALEFEEASLRDLDEITTLDGTLGFPEDDPVTSRLSGTITDVARAGEIVGEGDVLFTVDGEPVVFLQGTLPAYRGIGSEPTLLTLRSQAGGTITDLPDVDEQLAFNTEALRVDELPVLLLPGDLPAWRNLDEGAEGSDVEQLETALVALGYDPGNLTVDENFTSTTDSMIDAWQEEVGLEIDGRFALADAFFTPSEPIVTDVLVSVGDTVGVGTPILVVETEPAGARLRIENGDRGATVRNLQELLVAAGFDPGDINGIFDDDTEEAVEAFQESHDLEVTGVVDHATWNLLPRASESGTSDADVLQLQEALDRLGYEVPTNGVTDEATTSAIEAWQADIGADIDGTIDLGEVIFLPESVRVTEAVLTIGSPVHDGSVVLATSASSSVVVVDLPAEEQDLFEVGMAVSVEMPDGSEVPATVTEISGIAIRNQAGNVVFETKIELIDTTVGADLDQAPVDVLVVTDSRSQVLAVPVTALLALAEGGYAVEVELTGGSLRLVGVEPGLYADGWVEVTSEALAAGDRVVVP